MKSKLLLKSLTTSRSGNWNCSHNPVRSRAPAQCGYKAGGGRKHRADTTRPHCAPPAPHSPEESVLGADPPDPSTHRVRTFPNPLGLQKPPGLGWVSKPPFQEQFCRFIKYPTVHAQTPAEPMQPGAYTDWLPLRYPIPVI